MKKLLHPSLSRRPKAVPPCSVHSVNSVVSVVRPLVTTEQRSHPSSVSCSISSVSCNSWLLQKPNHEIHETHERNGHNKRHQLTKSPTSYFFNPDDRFSMKLPHSLPTALKLQRAFIRKGDCKHHESLKKPFILVSDLCIVRSSGRECSVQLRSPARPHRGDRGVDRTGRRSPARTDHA